jgi:hypothetical protein
MERNFNDRDLAGEELFPRKGHNKKLGLDEAKAPDRESAFGDGKLSMTEDVSTKRIEREYTPRRCETPCFLPFLVIHLSLRFLQR